MKRSRLHTVDCATVGIKPVLLMLGGTIFLAALAPALLPWTD